MNIHWFPGHMTKALRMMEDSLKTVDVLGYVLDLRAPFSCLNPELDALTQNKPCLIILNKADLADQAKTRLWQEYFERSGRETAVVSSVNTSERKKIADAFRVIAKPVTEKLAKKGVTRPVRAMIMGVPNSGKSTLINCISAKKTAATGDRPGVTRGKQWVRLTGGIELLDTPGTLWPKFEDESVGRHLAYIGSVKDDIIDTTEVAILFAEEMAELYPGALPARYGVDASGKKGAAILDGICAKRGYMAAGGEPDLDRCAKAVLDDFRKGRLGRITLETPPER